MKIIAPLIFLLLCGISAQPQTCRCRHVPKDERPSMGNEVLVQNGGWLRRIEGQIFFPNYITHIKKPAKDVMVEVYRYTKADRKGEVYQIPEQRPKIASCLTDDAGKFCFAGIRSGKYVLRIGTLGPNTEGWNGTHVLVAVDSRLRDRAKRLKIIMRAAT